MPKRNTTTWITHRDLAGTLAELQVDAADASDADPDFAEGIEYAIGEMVDEYGLE